MYTVFFKVTALFMLLSMEGLNAQVAVPATGGSASGSGGSSTYTIGQVVYITSSSTNASEAQGVQQPFEISKYVVGIDETEIKLELVASPNPTDKIITLTIGNYNNEKLTVQLFDLEGKLIDGKKINLMSTIIEMEDLPASTYLLRVLDDNSVVKAFRIIKR